MPANVGERISSMEAAFSGYEKYSHQRWHDLKNDLQPLYALPLEIGKLQGIFEGRMASSERHHTKALTEALSVALQPVVNDIALLRDEVEKLKTAKTQLLGARQLGIFLVQTLIAAMAALSGVLAMGGKH